MQRLILTIIAAFIMAIVFGPLVIPWLKRMKFGQTIYDLGPESHKKKQGIPTMGGVIFAVPALVAALAFAQGDTRWDFMLIAMLSAVGFGLVGFVDDFIKVKLKRSLGLTPKQKLVPQIILAIGMGVWAYLHPLVGSSLVVPFFGVEWELGWAYIPVMVFILVGTVNSANLLDGLDELILGEGGHLEAGGGVVHALRVHVGTEADDGAVLGGIGLKALEDLLAVVKQAGALGERDGVVGGKLALAPLAVLVVADIAVVGVLISEAEATPVDVLLLHHALHLLASARPARHW